MKAKGKAKRTYIDGTTICPVCGSGMARFDYTKNAVSNLNRKTDWEQWKKVTSWTETTYARGHGRMCMKCYGKRELRFWLIFGPVLASMLLMIILGACLSVKPLLSTGVALLALLIIYMLSKSAAELFDLFGLLKRNCYSAEEFVYLLIREHGEEFNRSDVIRVNKTE